MASCHLRPLIYVEIIYEIYIINIFICGHLWRNRIAVSDVSSLYTVFEGLFGIVTVIN